MSTQKMIRVSRSKWEPVAVGTTGPSDTLSSLADFPVSPVIRPTLLRRFAANEGVSRPGNFTAGLSQNRA
jgi:hypothetical protein